MAVAIASYQRRAEPRQEQAKESPIDMLLKGLNIAGQVTGIYSNVQQAKNYKAQTAAQAAAAEKAQAAEQRAGAGKMTEAEYQQTLGEGKFTEIRTKEGEELPTSVLRRSVIGPTGEERSVLLRQTGAQAADTQAGQQRTALQQKALEEATKTALKKSEDSFKNVSDLRKEYNANPITKDTQNISASWERVQGGFKEPSAAGDLNLIFGYMKMLDPGSTVREGEFANAQNAAGMPEVIRSKYNQILQGTRLTPVQRDDFFKQAGGVVQGQFKRQESIDKEFKRLVKQNKWDENQMMFVQKPEAFADKPKAPGQKKTVKSAADLPAL
jgi:hypothetical protein